MLRSLIEVLRPDIIKLPFVERYGGLAYPVQKQMEGYDEDGNTSDLVQTFPISSDLYGENCFDTGRYRDLIPDDSVASIFFFEDQSGLRKSPSSSIASKRRVGRKIYQYHDYVGTVRLIGWLNLPKLGIDITEGGVQIVNSLMKFLNLEYKNIQDPFPIHRIKFNVTSQEVKSSSIWDRYSFENVAELFLYPFDYFSLIVEVNATIMDGCIPDFIPQAEIDCQTF